MSETLKSPEERGFVITSVEQLTSGDSPYGWRPKTELLAGGRQNFLASIQAVIDKEGGLTEEKLAELGISKGNRPKSDLLEK